jgi:hypothetical protein
MRLSSIGSFGLLALLSACASDDMASSETVQPSDEDYANVAASLSATVAHDGGEVAAMRQAVALAHDQDEAGFTRTPDGSFVGTMAGLTYRYDIACASETSLTACDPSARGATVAATWTGSTDQHAVTLDLAHDASWQLTRMAGPIAHIDGTGHVDYQTQTFGSITSYAYDATYHVIVNDVRILEGTIDATVTGTHAGPGSAPYTISASITFASDDTASLTLDGTRHYQLALATGAITPL